MTFGCNAYVVRVKSLSWEHTLNRASVHHKTSPTQTPSHLLTSFEEEAHVKLHTRKAGAVRQQHLHVAPLAILS